MIARWNSSQNHQGAILIMTCSQGLTFQGSPSTFKIPQQIDKNNLGDHSTFSKDRHQQIKPNRKIPPKFPSTKPIFIILPKREPVFFSFVLQASSYYQAKQGTIPGEIPENHPAFALLDPQKFASWWLNQPNPFEKYARSSNWIIFPQGSGWTSKNFWVQPPPGHFGGPLLP